MAELFIKPNGVVEQKVRNYERCDQYFVKKHNGKIGIFNEETKELVSVYDTRDDADEYFYDISIVDQLTFDKINLYKLNIQNDFKVKDLIDLIESHIVLTFFMDEVFPFWKSMRGNKQDKIVIARYLDIIDNDAEFDVITTDTFDYENQDALINFGPYFVRKDGETLFKTDEAIFTLFDLLKCLFLSYHHFPETVLRKNGLYNLETKSYIEDNQIMKYLFSECNIEPGYTLTDLFMLVEKDTEKDGFLKDFIIEFCECFYIDEYIAEVKKEHKDDFELSSVEIYAKCAIHKNHIDSSTICHGIYPPGSEYTSCALDFSPLNEYCFLPLVLKKDVYIWSRNKSKYHEYGNFNYRFNLLDILNGIFEEISFHGSVENRDARLQDLKGMVDEINENVDKIISHDSVEEKYLSDEEDNDE